MCGINGISWKDKALVKTMNDALRHRGPDDEGIYLFEGVSFGHVRLSIIDLTDAGNQPMGYEKSVGASSDKHHRENKDKTKFTITFNGEIYNYQELREELKKKDFRSQPRPTQKSS